ALPDRRISASSVPKKMPPSVEIAVSSIENTNPVAMNLLTTSQLNQEKSRAPMSVASPAGAGDDEAGDSHALFDEGEDAVHGEGRHRIHRRHADVDLDAARGLLLRLHREPGELRDRDGEGHRGVLQQVHRLAGERRDD